MVLFLSAMSERPPARPARADLHVHTSCSSWRHLRYIHPRDSYLDPADAYAAALESGMTFVAVTDHDSIEGALRLLDDPGTDAAKVIVGEEVECRFPETGQWVHVSVLGLDETDHARLQALAGDVREVCGFCGERGLLFVLNHPFQSYRFQKPLEAFIEDILSLFTHVEGLNGGVHSMQNRAVSALCARAGENGRRVVQVGGSDAHSRRRVGMAFTEARAGSKDGFLDEIKAGRCTVGGRTVSAGALVRDVYANVGEYYGRLYTGRGEARTAGAYALDVAVATACLPAALGGLPLASVLASQGSQKFVSKAVLAKLQHLDWNGVGGHDPFRASRWGHDPDSRGRIGSCPSKAEVALKGIVSQGRDGVGLGG
jgi:predicted metal-dependent phosphoesterase TrpH